MHDTIEEINHSGQLFHILSTRPSSGQFVAVWQFNKQVWSACFTWKNGQLYRRSSFNEAWLPVPIDIQNLLEDPKTLIISLENPNA